MQNPPQPPESETVPYSLSVTFVFQSQPSTGDLIESSTEFDSSSDDSAETSNYHGVLKHSKYTIEYKGAEILTWEVNLKEKKVGKDDSYEILMPNRFFARSGGPRFIEPEKSLNPDLSNFPCVLNGLMPYRMIAKHKKKKKKDVQAQESWGIFPLPPVVEKALGDLRTCLRRIHYLGPLRTPGQRIYFTHQDGLPNLDSTGEFLPYLLRQTNIAKVRNFKPRTWEVKEEPLLLALNKWLYYFRTGDPFSFENDYNELEVRNVQGILTELYLRGFDGELRHALADSGFGYSQILPILVRGLIMGNDSTLFVEQPELHLNPAIQVRVAEFLLGLALCGKQVLVETHSEHIVNSIRVQIAEDETSRFEKIANIFVLSGGSFGVSCREMGILSDGSLPDWPKEFFGEAAGLAGRLLRAKSKRAIQGEAKCRPS